MVTEAFYKLARPLTRGVKVQIANGQAPEHVKNRMVRDMLNDLPQFGGEIVVGKPCDPNCHEITQEFLNDDQLMLPFVFWVYDMRTTENYSLADRLKIAETMVMTCHPCIQYVDHEYVTTKAELDAYASKIVRDNFFPGVVLREPFGTFGTYDEEIPAESLGLQLQ